MAVRLLVVAVAQRVIGQGHQAGVFRADVLNDIALPEMGDDEEAMLSEAFYVKSNSRLGCQIPITTELEGLELELAPEY